jgi:hypothetical protein
MVNMESASDAVRSRPPNAEQLRYAVLDAEVLIARYQRFSDSGISSDFLEGRTFLEPPAPALR